MGIFFAFLITLSFNNHTFAQPGGGNGNGTHGGPGANFWNLQGNQLNTGEFLGSTNNTSLIFKTNDLERMRLTENGFLGIAQSNPAYLLDVNGSAQISGTLYGSQLDLSGTANLNELNVANNATINGVLTANQLNISQQATFNDLWVTGQLRVGNSLYVNEPGPFEEVAVTSGILAIAKADNNGIGDYEEEIKVGIGTNDPQRELHIKGFTCANCPVGPGDPTFTSYIRLEDEFYDMNTGNPVESGYWDIGVGGSSGTFFLGNDDVGNNTFKINDEGRVNMFNITLKDDFGNGDEYFASKQVGNTNFLQLQKDLTFLSFSDDDPNEAHTNGVWAIQYNPSAEGLNFWKPFPNDFGHGNYFLFLANDGNVGVGTSTPPYTLSVEGTIGAREIIVETEIWEDRVFYSDYKLMPLEQLKEFTESNCHLPGIPSEDVVIENGINVGEMNVLLLGKVEELTLYLIEQNETIKSQHELVEQQQEMLNEQQKQLKLLMEEVKALKNEGGQ